MKLLIRSGLLSTVLIIIGCNASPEALERDYKRTCFGDSTTKCKHKLLDWQEARMKHFLSEVHADKNEIIRDKGEAEYEKLVAHYEAELLLIDAERPGLFVSTFFSDAHAQ